MSRFRAGFWGPRPRWALIPVAAIGAVVAAVILRDPGPDGMLDGPVMVTALKPASLVDSPASLVASPASLVASPASLVASDDDASGDRLAAAEVETPTDLPIEVRYGVPSSRTAKLWQDLHHPDRH